MFGGGRYPPAPPLQCLEHLEDTHRIKFEQIVRLSSCKGGGVGLRHLLEAYCAIMFPLCDKNLPVLRRTYGIASDEQNFEIPPESAPTGHAPKDIRVQPLAHSPIRITHKVREPKLK